MGCAAGPCNGSRRIPPAVQRFPIFPKAGHADDENLHPPSRSRTRRQLYVSLSGAGYPLGDTPGCGKCCTEHAIVRCLRLIKGHNTILPTGVYRLICVCVDGSATCASACVQKCVCVRMPEQWTLRNIFKDTLRVRCYRTPLSAIFILHLYTYRRIGG